MNVVLLVVDSLRASSVGGGRDAPPTPFLDELGRRTVHFRRAHATECWTLPTHLSMFTGLLPSQHGAHFQNLAYCGRSPTIAELLAEAGHHTEVVTRNTLFDGTIPGATRGFRENTRIFGRLGAAAAPLALLLAMAKPRVRRLLRASGFLSALQRENRDMVATVARMAVPADRDALAYALERMTELRRRGRRFFFFLNLFDVHMPYSPSPSSPLRPLTSLAAVAEAVRLPAVLPRISSHAYLRPGFRMSEAKRRMLRGRYESAIELMDAKLAQFYDEARRTGLLDDTLLVVTSDHGEAFGEHGLYFHDASVWQTHLHVPLWIHHPDCAPRAVDDVVSTRDLFALMRSAGLGLGLSETLLDASAVARRPVALAEHFHYALGGPILPQYAVNLASAIVGRHKIAVRGDGAVAFDLAADPGEMEPRPTTVAGFLHECRRDRAAPAALDAAAEHVQRWSAAPVAA